MKPSSVLLMALLYVGGCTPAKPSDEPEHAPGASGLAASSSITQAKPTGTLKPGEPQSPTAEVSARFTLVLPGNRIAKIPVSVIERFVDPGATAVHKPKRPGQDFVNKHVDDDGQWHTDYEYGECFYHVGSTTERTEGWHRHPVGTEYAELYERN